MSESESQITTIPQIRRIFSDTKANLDALTGLKDEALAYATDTGLLYRQNGAGAANWVAITVGAALRDTKANLDALTGLLSGTLAYGTDTAVFYRQNGAGAANWEEVGSVTTPFAPLRDTKANLDALTGLLDGDLAYGTDTAVFYRQNGAGAANWEEVGSVTAAGVARELTVALFQANAATGTATTPANMNDNNTGTQAEFDTIGKYCEVDFGQVMAIQKWRQNGDGTNAGDGEFKIEYYDLEAHAWADWVTGIATWAAASWSSPSTETVVFTDKIRVTCVTVDTAKGGRWDLEEFEVYY